MTPPTPATPVTPAAPFTPLIPLARLAPLTPPVSPTVRAEHRTRTATAPAAQAPPPAQPAAGGAARGHAGHGGLAHRPSRGRHVQAEPHRLRVLRQPARHGDAAPRARVHRRRHRHPGRRRTRAGTQFELSCTDVDPWLASTHFRVDDSANHPMGWVTAVPHVGNVSGGVSTWAKATAVSMGLLLLLLVYLLGFPAEWFNDTYDANEERIIATARRRLPQVLRGAHGGTEETDAPVAASSRRRCCSSGSWPWPRSSSASSSPSSG